MFLRVARHVVLVLLAGAMALGQHGTSFSPVNPPQAQVPAQDTSATPASSTNPAASTLPVPPSARTNGAPVSASESSATPSAPPASPASTASEKSSTGVVSSSGSASMNPPSGNGSEASPAASGSYARPLADDLDVQIAPNTEMRAVLDTPLSTKTSKAGDRFSATVVDSVRGSNGNVAIPAGTRLQGEVTDAAQGKVKTKPTETATATATSALKEKGKLSLRFRDAILPNGQTVPLNTSLVSINSTGAKALKQSGSSKDVVVDTTSGSAFGGPLHGFAIGTMAGGGYILAIRSKDVDLPAQTGMVIRFDPQPSQQ